MPAGRGSRSPRAKGRGFISRRALEREELVFFIAAGACAATLLLHLIIQSILSGLASSGRHRLWAARESHILLQRVEKEERYNQELALAERVKKGDQSAAEVRAKEWERRQDLVADFAISPREQILLQMQELSKESSLSSAAVLEKLALLAAPLDCGPKPLTKLTEAGAGFNLEIAYPCKEVLDHSLTGRSFPSYYREVVRTTAGIVKDVMAFGNSRGLNQLLVTCWMEVKVTSEGGRKESREVRHQFVVTAVPGGRDWRRMSRAEVERVWSKKTDNLKTVAAEK